MRQQKRDIESGSRIRTFSDMLQTPDYSHKALVKEACQMEGEHSNFVTFTDQKAVAKVAQLLSVYKQLAGSTSSETDQFTVKQAIKLLAKKVVRLVPSDLHVSLKIAAEAQFKHA
jgi:hypothetical protein